MKKLFQVILIIFAILLVGRYVRQGIQIRRLINYDYSDVGECSYVGRWGFINYNDDVFYCDSLKNIAYLNASDKETAARLVSFLGDQSIFGFSKTANGYIYINWQFGLLYGIVHLFYAPSLVFHESEFRDWKLTNDEIIKLSGFVYNHKIQLTKTFSLGDGWYIGISKTSLIPG